MYIHCTMYTRILIDLRRKDNNITHGERQGVSSPRSSLTVGQTLPQPFFDVVTPSLLSLLISLEREDDQESLVTFTRRSMQVAGSEPYCICASNPHLGSLHVFTYRSTGPPCLRVRVHCRSLPHRMKNTSFEFVSLFPVGAPRTSGQPQ
jgi:hypothetical protein